jgi:hypothetical protein
MKLMNDYLDEDIKFDEELHREDDSLKSSVSTSSLDSNEDVEETQSIDKSSINSLFNSNVKKVINTLKITNPNKNINQISNNYLLPIKNQDINNMLASLSKSFDTDINDIKLDTIFENSVTTIADSLEKALHISDTQIPEMNDIKIESPTHIYDSINGQISVEETAITETEKPALNLKQMVDIFNTQDDVEEDAEVSDDPDKEEPEKADTSSNNKKKKKKKKKKQ